LACHPDKVQGKEREFQAISVAYEVLKNPESRGEYDETGELVDDEEDRDSTTFDAWKAYFSNIFGRMTTNDIDRFAEKYKCSEEEQQDVLKYYRECEGNLVKMLEKVMLSTERDTLRWVEDFIRPAIEDESVPDYTETLEKTLKICQKKINEEAEVVEAGNDDEDATESEESDAQPAKKSRKKAALKKAARAKTRKKTKAEREAEEAEALMAKIQNKGSLAKRKAGFDALLSDIAGKYGEIAAEDPMDDEEFERIQKKMNKKHKNKVA
jgi:DnaJ family protein C protein 9